MNFSTIKDRVYAYLGAGKSRATVMDSLCEECLTLLEEAAPFRAMAQEYSERLPVLQAGVYADFLAGADSYFLVAATLGGESERHLRRLGETDMARAVMSHAVAAAYLEYKTEEYIKTLAPVTSYLFCPGYAGSNVKDNIPLARALRVEKIGIGVSEGGMLLPQKSMLGIVAVGVTPAMGCGNCAKKETCEARKDGRVCYR